MLLCYFKGLLHHYYQEIKKLIIAAASKAESQHFRTEATKLLKKHPKLTSK